MVWFFTCQKAGKKKGWLEVLKMLTVDVKMLTLDDDIVSVIMSFYVQ